MSATYTWDVFASLDGFASHHGDWGGYWGKQGPELLAHRSAQYEPEQRLVLGATTHRDFGRMRATAAAGSDVFDPWVGRMLALPTTVVSSTLPVDEPGVTVVTGDAADVVASLKAASDVPIRSHGSLSLNRSLLAAGLVDRVQVTLFPVVTGQTGDKPVFAGAADLDLELLSTTVLDGRTLELVYRPALHG